MVQNKQSWIGRAFSVITWIKCLLQYIKLEKIRSCVVCSFGLTSVYSKYVLSVIHSTVNSTEPGFTVWHENVSADLGRKKGRIYVGEHQNFQREP